MSGIERKQLAALEALNFIEDNMIVGVGTGSTTNYFIEGLAKHKARIEATVASSQASAKLLKEQGLPVVDPNSVGSIDLYVDGADEFNPQRMLIKGGGAALTGEKIVVSMSQQFICIVDESKQVARLGNFPLPVEVIPLARSQVARQLVKLGGDPIYREGTLTDYGNVILDVHNLNIDDPVALETTINQIPGVVTNGLFAHNKADKILIGTDQGVKIL